MNIKVLKKVENTTGKITLEVTQGHLNHLFLKGLLKPSHKVTVTYIEGTKEVLLVDELPAMSFTQIKAPLPVKRIQQGSNPDGTPIYVNIPLSTYKIDLGSVYLGNGRKLKVEIITAANTGSYDLSMYSTSNSLLPPHFITYDSKPLLNSTEVGFTKSLSLSLFAEDISRYSDATLEVESSNQKYSIDVASLIEIQQRDSSLCLFKTLNGIPVDASVKASSLVNDNVILISKSLEFPYGHINTEITRNLEMSYFSTLALEKKDANFVIALQRSGMGYSKEFYADNAYKFQR